MASPLAVAVRSRAEADEAAAWKALYEAGKAATAPMKKNAQRLLAEASILQLLTGAGAGAARTPSSEEIAKQAAEQRPPERADGASVYLVIVIASAPIFVWMTQEDMTDFDAYVKAIQAVKPSFCRHRDMAWQHWTSVRGAWMEDKDEGRPFPAVHSPLQ